MKFDYFAWATRHRHPTGRRYSRMEHVVYFAFTGAAMLGLGWLGGAIGNHAIAAMLSQEKATHPHYVRLKDDMCNSLKAAAARYPKEQGRPAPEFSCSFTAYMFRVEHGGGWVTYGYSDNIKGQCGFIAANAIESVSDEIDGDAPALRELPKTCAQFQGLHPKAGF